MGLQLDQVVPWGRSLSEYLRMFDLSLPALPSRILDCAGGPASVNAELTRHGHHVISCDPIYQFSVAEIQQRIQDTAELLVAKLHAHREAYLWQELQSPEHLAAVRLAAMQQFLADFPVGQTEGRYRVAELPQLPFADKQFDLALCSHFLFSYSDHFSEEFHLASIRELCRVGIEVRLFPLLTVSGEKPAFLDSVRHTLIQQGYHIEIKTVDYQFQKGGNQMLICCRG